jgi:hypothetical protein
MTYDKNVWNNRILPRVNATNLNKIEQGIYDAHEMATGRCATITVAANDSTALEKQHADYVCPGTADQTMAQTAITAAGIGGARFLRGTYNFTGYVNTVAGVTISGPGATFFLSNSTNGSLIRVAHNDVTIKNITMDGNGGNQTSGNGIIEVTADSTNLTIDHVHFKNAWNDGLYAVGTSGHRIDGLMMSYCAAENSYNGLTQTGGLINISYANNIQIDHCVMDDFRHNANYIDGVKVIHATNVQISHLFINNITGHGVFVGYGSEDVQISDIIFTSDIGYTLESVCVEFAADGATDGVGRNKRVSVSNVSHYSTAGGNNGLYFDTCDDLAVSNCTVEIATAAIINPLFAIRYIDVGKFVNCVGRGLLGDDSSGFKIEGCDDVSLSNCAMVDSPVWAWATMPRAAVDVQTSENTVFTSCTLRDLPTNGILAQSASVRIDDCVFENMGVYAGWHAWCIYVKPNYGKVEIRGNTFRLGSGAQTKGTYLESNCDDCIIINNMYGSLASHHLHGAGCDNLTMRNNVGYVTENSGTATLLSAGTSIVVTHGLSATPVAGDIMVVPIETWGNMTKFWLDTYTATQFTVHADIAPGADTDFAWKAIVL